MITFKKSTVKPRKTGQYLCILLDKYSWCKPYYSLAHFTTDKNKYSSLHLRHPGWKINRNTNLVGWTSTPKITSKLIKDLT